MPTIFVDANIFLDCYRRQGKGYRELLRSLCSLQSSTIITDTVISEVERNRVSVYSEANKLERKSISLGILEMYSHYSEETADVDKTNREIRLLDQEIKRKQNDLQKQIEEIHEKNLRAIVEGKDDVSIVISELAKGAASETQAQLERARLRKERGQGPGKKNDPLGDQISWEQLLDHVEGTGSVWIVSRDGDYTIPVGDDVFLQPSLYRELRSRSGVTSVKCFRSLAMFFEAFNKSGLADQDSLPPQDAIDAAAEESQTFMIQESLPKDYQIISLWRHVENAIARYLVAKASDKIGSRPANAFDRRSLLSAGLPITLVQQVDALKMLRNKAVHDGLTASDLSDADLDRYREVAADTIAKLVKQSASEKDN